jgi:quercetin dioxygenase-like cupin family protein
MYKRTKEEIDQLIANLPDEPCGLISMLKPGDFHGILEWEVKEGRMLSYPVWDEPACQEFHTQFLPGTVVDWHDHGKFSSEIIVCLKGSLTIILESGEQIILNESEFIVIDKSVKHMAIISDKPTDILAKTIPRER